MKLIYSFFILFAFCQSLSSQTHKVEWFEKQTVGSEITPKTRVIADESSYYMVVRPFRKYLDRLLKINKQGIIEVDKHLVMDELEHEIRVYGLSENNGKLYGYYRVIDGKNAAILRDEINKQTLAFIGHPVEVITGSANPMDLLKPAWEKPERMDQGYFSGRIVPDNYAFIDFPEQNMHLILKRESYKAKDQVNLKAILLDDSYNVLNQGQFQLPSSNINTSLMKVLPDDKGGLYFITGDYVEKTSSCHLHYLAPGSNRIQTSSIPLSAYVHSIDGVTLSDGIMLVAHKAADHKKEEYALSAIKYSFDSKKLSVERSLSDMSWDRWDRLHMVTNGETTGVFIQRFFPGSADQNGNPGSRIAGDIQTFMLDTKGETIWKKTIENHIVTPGGGISCDSYYPFTYNSRFYLLHNTHPENPGLAAKGEKLKKAYPGKDRISTELILFGEDGKLTRDFIHMQEDKFATIPVHTSDMKNGKYLMYADHVMLGNSFMMGVLDVSN